MRPTGHPAGGRYVSRQVSWLTGRCSCPGLPRANPSGADGPPPAAYSCGGSSGFTPASLLAPRRGAARRTSTAHISPGRAPTVKWNISISLYEDHALKRECRRRVLQRRASSATQARKAKCVSEDAASAAEDDARQHPVLNARSMNDLVRPVLTCAAWGREGAPAFLLRAMLWRSHGSHVGFGHRLHHFLL